LDESNKISLRGGVKPGSHHLPGYDLPSPFHLYQGHILKTLLQATNEKSNKNLPATRLLSSNPCFLSLMNTAAVRATAMKYKMLKLNK